MDPERNRKKAWRSSGDEDDMPLNLEVVLARYVDRINAGQRIQAEEVYADYPDGAEEILDQLGAFQGIDFEFHPTEPLGTLGDYTLRRQIGRGGMGVVYEAWQENLDRRVALKVLPAGVAADERSLQRFVREAKTAAQLDHPNVVYVHGMGLENDTPYYAMEYVEGETLAQIVARIKDAEPETETPFGPKDELAYFGNLAKAFADVADGLQHAHSKGVTHRDIKPSNLILDSDDRLRILDFGLARLEGQESLTLSGDFVGTPLYMSPEQARRKKIPVDHRTDVYSLGATMYEATCDRPPFRGRDHADTLSQIIECDPVAPRKVNSRVPKDLETIVLKCLRKSSRDRYGTAEALAQDLRRFVRGDPVEARPQARLEKSIRWFRRRGAMITILIVGLALVSGIGLLLRRQSLARIEREREQYTPRVLAEIERIQSGYGSSVTTGGKASSVDGVEFLLPEDLELLGGEKTAALIEESIVRLEDIIESDPRRPEARYHKARGLLLLGRQGAAALELRETLERTPNFAPAALLLETLSGDNGGVSLTRVLDGEAGVPRWAVLWVRAHRAMKEERWQDAIDAQEELVSYERENGPSFAGSSMETLLNRARARLELKEYDDASEDLAVARWSWPESLEPALLLGKAYFLRGAREQAEKKFEGLFAEAKHPDEAAFWITLAYRSLDEFEEGLRWANFVKEDQIRLRLEAICLIHQYSFSEARDVARQAISLNDRDWVSLLIFAAASLLALPKSDAFYEERLEEIYAQLEKADELHPNHAATFAVLGLTRFSQGRLDDAAQLCETAIRLDPRDPNGYWILGWVEQERGDVAKAERLLREAPVRDPAIYCVLGQLYQRQGRFEDALVQLELALELRPDYGDARRIRGEVFLAQNRYDDASEVFRDMETLPRAHGRGYQRLALVYWKRNDLERAMNSADAALKRDSRLKIARHLLDWLSDRKEGKESARNHLQKLAADLRAVPPLEKIFHGELEELLSKRPP